MMQNVGEILTEMDRERGVEPPPPPKAAEPFTPATIADTPPLPEPGIYFGMPEDDYHALPALSSSGIKRLAAGPMKFWAETPWLSEAARRREAEKKEKAEERIHRTIGRAYHCRILEGEEAYAERYARELAASECEGALESTDQIKAAIKALDAKPVSKVPDALPDGTAYERAAKKEDWIAQLLDLDPDACILAELRRRHAALHDGKTFIPFDAHEQIEIAAKMIEGDKMLRHAVTGGHPEVTLIWHDFETGVPLKARCDRLKLKAVVDLKSIRDGDIPIEHALRFAIARYKYNIQPSLYGEGVQAVKALVRASNASVDGSASQDELDWVQKWAAIEDEPEWWWLFQQSGVAPVARLVQYPMAGVTRSITDDIIRTVKRQFRELSEQYGTEPWLDRKPPYMIDDEAIPPSATENLRSE